jgi:dynein heavy chain
VKTPFQRLCILRCLRPDKVTPAIQNFVRKHLGANFIEPPPFDLATSFESTDVSTPLVFILSPGSDPFKAFLNFADQVGMRTKIEGASLGKGQGALAAKLIEDAKVRGKWVLLQVLPID